MRDINRALDEIRKTATGDASWKETERKDVLWIALVAVAVSFVAVVLGWR